MTDIATSTGADRWRARIIDCRPADRVRVEAGIRRCYAEAGRSAPTAVVWVRSPSEATRLAADNRRVRLLSRLRPPRRARQRRSARVRDRLPGTWRSAVRGAVVLGTLALEVIVVVTAAATGHLFEVAFLGLLWFGFFLAAATTFDSIAPFRVIALALTPTEPPPGRDLWPPAIELVAFLVVLMLPPTLVSWLRLVRGSAPGGGWTDQLGDATGPITAIAAAVGLVVGTALGLRRPSWREWHEVALWPSAELDDWSRRAPVADPPTGSVSIRWSPPGGRLRGRADGSLQESALSHRAVTERDEEPGSVRFADVFSAYEQGRLGPTEGRSVTAYADAGEAWAWWASLELAIACERPAELVLDPETARSGDLQLHCADGPAVRWRDGTVEYWWHGVPVPRDLVGGRWSVRRIRRERDSEVRRAAIERMGWPEFVRRARLRLVSSAPDPGNPGRELRLYALPRRFVDGRLLVMTNGSPDRSGRERVYAETVPPDLDDAVAAAAWQYDLPKEIYQQLQRRT